MNIKQKGPQDITLETSSFVNLQETDPEFARFFQDFALKEVLEVNTLDEKTRWLAILSVLVGSGASKAFYQMLPFAVKAGLTREEVKEMIYQAVAYCGFGRVYPFFEEASRVFRELNIPLNKTPRGTTTPENRREMGTKKQMDLFGPQMEDFWKSGPEEKVHINRWLAANCFGDYYTRNGLDDRQREMITFCFLYAQGGCEPQALSHAKANYNVGNDRLFMIMVVSQCMPYIGYPRTLNALRILDEAAGIA